MQLSQLLVLLGMFALVWFFLIVLYLTLSHQKEAGFRFLKLHFSSVMPNEIERSMHFGMDFRDGLN